MLEFYNFYKDYLYDLYDIPSWLFYESLYNSCESYRFYPGQQKEKDDYDLTKLIVKKYADKIKLDGDESGCSTINMFVGLCKNKQYDLVKFYISKIEDHNEKYETGKLNENQHRISYPWSGFAGAFEGGHLEIIELLKEYYEIDWEWALRGACRGGHIDLIKLCLESDAKTEYGSKLVSTCESGNIDAVKYVLSVDDSENIYAFNGMLVACEIGNFEIAELMHAIYEKNKKENKPIKNEPLGHMNLEETFRTVCDIEDYTKAIKMIDWIIEKFPDININIGFCGSMEIVKYLISIGAKDYNFGLYSRVHYGTIEEIKFFLDLGADIFAEVDKSFMRNTSFKNLCSSQNTEVIKYVLTNYKISHELINSGFEILNGRHFKEDHIELINLFISLGADNFDDVFEDSMEEDPEDRYLMIFSDLSKFLIMKGATGDKIDYEWLKIEEDEDVHYLKKRLQELITNVSIEINSVVSEFILSDISKIIVDYIFKK